MAGAHGDVDADLVEAARAALAGYGYAPTLVVQDGFHGYPARAPYDRIIATCSVHRIPQAWVDQIAPAGVIVAPLANCLLVAPHRHADGSLSGRASSAAFMPLRSPELPAPAEPQLASGDPVPRRLDKWFQQYLSSVPTSAPNFYVGLRLPDLRFAGRWNAGPDQEPMLAGDDGSWARVRRQQDGSYLVVQAGPRQLWDLYEAAVDEWWQLGRPLWTRFGMTITTDRRQLVWLDRPESGHVWEL